MKSNIFSLLICLSLLLVFSCGNDDDGQGGSNPVISLSNTTISEGNETSTVAFEVQLSVASSLEVSVDYTTSDGEAVAGEDYKTTSGTLSFAPNATRAEITVDIIGDDIKESDEWFLIELSNPQNGTLDPIQTFGRVTLANDDTNLQISDEGYTTPESYAGFDLVWQDEFEGASINTSDWTFEMGDGCPNLCGWGNNELQAYTGDEKNAYLTDGYLVIEALAEGAGYSSARMITKGKQEFQYGRVDIRAILPEGQGLWPALWMLGSNIDDVSWPACGEIDIMEIVGHEPGTLHGTVHWDNNGGYANYGQSTTLASGKFIDEFHVFSITWDETAIRWYLDDVQYNVIDITPAALDEFRQEFFFIFNVAVGGNWPGDPDGSTQFPQAMIVDYIRVFQEQ